MEEEKKQLLLDIERSWDRNVETMGKVVVAHNKVREEAVRYIYQVITAIGVIAGFGFTAVASVENVYRFLFAELILFSAMAVGMWLVRELFITNEAEYYTGHISKLGSVIDKKRKVLENENSSMEELIKKRKEIYDEESHVFDLDKKSPNINSKFMLVAILYLFIGGSVLLLSSFINFPPFFNCATL